MTKQKFLETQQNSDEVDLIELFMLIWGNKKWVLLFAILFTVGSVIYALKAKEQWTSKAELIVPNVKEMGGYLDVYERYYAIISQKQNQKDAKEREQDQSEKVSEKLFAAFSSAVGSNEKQINSLSQSDIMKRLIKSGATEKSAMLLLINSIKVTKPNKDKKSTKGIDYLAVEFSDVDAIESQKALRYFINFTNDDVRSTMVDELKTEIATKIKTLGIRKESIKLFTDTAQGVRLDNLKRALQIAQKAGIKDYSLIGNNGSVASNSANGEVGIKLEDDRLAEGNFLFLLGENYLSAQIDTLSNSPVIYPEDYYLSDLQIKLLSGLLINQKDLSFNSFHFQSSPSLPLMRDKPKRALIVIIGAMAGFILGVLIALLLGVVENRKRYQNV